MTSKGEHTVLEPKTAEEYRQTADAHTQTLKDFWKRFLVSGLFVIAAVIIIFACLAWFVSNNQVKAETASLSAKGVRYSLSAEGANQGVYNVAAAAKGLSTIDSMLVSESSNLNNVGTTDKDGNQVATSADVLGPGSYGKLTFTVTPYATDLGDVVISLKRALVTRDGKTLLEDDAATDANANEKTLQALLSGHILFFESKDANGYYSSPILSDTITIRSRAFCEEGSTQTTKLVTCTLYWVWPERFENIALTGVVNYTQNLFASNDSGMEEQNKNGYSALLSDVNDSHSKYFLSDAALPDSIVPGMSTANLQLCSSAYNQADEKLGSEVQYLQVRMTSHEGKTSAGGDADA